MEPLGLEHLAGPLEIRQALGELGADAVDRSHPPRPRRHEVRLRIDGHALVPPDLTAGQRIERDQLVDLVPEQADPQPELFVGGEDLDDVAADPEGAPRELVIVALVLNLHELAEDLVALDPLTALERQDERVVRLRRSEAVDARYARDDDDVVALEEGSGRRQPEPVDLVVDDRLLLDVRVARWDVGLRLVVVVVADEELHGVARKEAAELLIELRGQRLVVDHHEGGTVHAREHLRHREGLARAGHPEEHLRAIAPFEPLGELGDRGGLIPSKPELALEPERLRLADGSSHRFTSPASSSRRRRRRRQDGRPGGLSAPARSTPAAPGPSALSARLA